MKGLKRKWSVHSFRTTWIASRKNIDITWKKLLYEEHLQAIAPTLTLFTACANFPSLWVNLLQKNHCDSTKGDYKIFPAWSVNVRQNDAGIPGDKIQDVFSGEHPTGSPKPFASSMLVASELITIYSKSVGFPLWRMHLPASWQVQQRPSIQTAGTQWTSVLAVEHTGYLFLVLCGCSQCFQPICLCNLIPRPSSQTSLLERTRSPRNYPKRRRLYSSSQI